MSVIYDSVLHKLREQDTIRVSGAVVYRGTVASINHLPGTGMVPGDMYRISSGSAASAEYWWTGSSWDPMGPSGTVTTSGLSAYLSNGAYVTSSDVEGMVHNGALTIYTEEWVEPEDPESSGAIEQTSQVFTANDSRNVDVYVPFVGSGIVTLTQGGSDIASFTTVDQDNQIVELPAGATVVYSSGGSGHVVTEVSAGQNIGMSINASGALTVANTLLPVSYGFLGDPITVISSGSHASMTFSSGVLTISGTPLPTYSNYPISTFSAGANVTMAHDSGALIINAGLPKLGDSAVSGFSGGAGISLGMGASGIMVISNTGGGGGGSPVTYGGSAIASIVSGTNAVMSYDGATSALTIGASDTVVVASGQTVTSIASGTGIGLDINGGIMTISATGGGGGGSIDAITFNNSSVTVAGGTAGIIANMDNIDPMTTIVDLGSSASATLEPGKAYVWSMTGGARQILVTGGSSSKTADSLLDLYTNNQDPASVTLGPNVVLAGALPSSGHVQLAARWMGESATLYPLGQGIVGATLTVNGTEQVTDYSSGVARMSVTVPIATTQLYNDAGFITEADLPTYSSGGSNYVISEIKAGANIGLDMLDGVLTISGTGGGGGGAGIVVSGTTVTSMTAGDGVTLAVNGAVVTVSESPDGIIEIPAASASYPLSDGRFRHVPQSAVTYTMPTVADATKAHEIILDVSFASTTTAAFVMSDSTPVTPYQQPTISAGAYVRYICDYSPLQAAWGIMPIPLAHSELPCPVVVSGAVVSQMVAGSGVTLAMNSGTVTIAASGGGGGGGGVTLEQARRQAMVFG